MTIDNASVRARIASTTELPRPLSFPRVVEHELFFRGEKLVTGRHRIHPYPAMLHPLVIDRLLADYAQKDHIVFDPFCGSGAVLLGALNRGHTTLGFDINPLGLLIARAKTMQYDNTLLVSEFQDLRSRIRRKRAYDIPQIKNLEYWYDPRIAQELGRIRRTLMDSDYRYAPLFIACFAHVCRSLSFTRKTEFKRHREVEDKRDRTNVEARSYFLETLESFIPVFSSTNPESSNCTLILRNSETPIDHAIRYDLIITSPPYGDHKTTVAYGQYSSFGNEWTKDLNSFNSIDYGVDSEGLGRRDTVTFDPRDYSELQLTLEAINRARVDRGRDVLMYFNGYVRVLQNICNELNKGGMICAVVGNRTVAGVNVPLDQITAQILLKNGLVFEAIRTREISNKVMPLENSPSNIPGRTSPTITREHVVVFRKR